MSGFRDWSKSVQLWNAGRTDGVIKRPTNDTKNPRLRCVYAPVSSTSFFFF